MPAGKAPEFERPLLFAMPLLCGDNPLIEHRSVEVSALHRHDALPAAPVGRRHVHRRAAARLSIPRRWSRPRRSRSTAASSATRWAVRSARAARRAGSCATPRSIRGRTGFTKSAKPVPGALTQPGVVSTTNDANGPADLAAGLEPGDITKYSARAVASGFQRVLEPADRRHVPRLERDLSRQHRRSGRGSPRTSCTGGPRTGRTRSTAVGAGGAWSPTQATNRGDLEMVSIWPTLPFLVARSERPAHVTTPSWAASSSPNPRAP